MINKVWTDAHEGGDPSGSLKGKSMKNLVLGSVITLSALSLAACETTSSRPYTVSTQNIMAAQSVLSGATVSVGEFTAAAEVNTQPTCRALGRLEIAPGQSPVDYVRSAFQDELFNAGVVRADGTEIRGEITELDFNSFGTGSWNVTLKLTSDALPEGITVSEDYSFSTSYSALSACQNVIDAFQPTVSSLLNQAITHPDFRQLAGQ